MSAATAGGCDPLAAIRREFPGWNAWRSSAGRYWAARVKNRRKPPELPLDESVTWAMTVDGDTPAQLREALIDQEARSGP